MAFLELYQNLSYYSLYKSEIYSLGINSLLIFNLDGVPFIARDYSNNNIKTSNDFIFLSAFISSTLKFIKVQGNSYITDFGIGTSRFYLKFDQNNTAYCLVLNELIHRRITGEQLIIFVEMVTNALKRLFNTYRADGTGFLKKVKYDEKFCLEIDRIFLNLYAELVAKAFEGQKISEYLFDHNILIQTHEPLKNNVKETLLNIGIKGLLVCGCGGDKPVAIRNYEKNTIENTEGGYFICGLSHLLNKFALTNFGFFTDVGFGFQRVIFKFKTENKITLCLILSEVLYRRVTGETLNMFSELMLTRVHKSIRSALPHLCELARVDDDDSLLEQTQDKLDAMMLENAKAIYDELQS